MSLPTIERRVAQFEAPPAGPPAESAEADFTALTQPQPAADPVAPPPDPGAQRTIVERAAAANGVDPALVLAVIENESHFDAAATSPAGAMGLMQLMPATARAFSAGDPYDATQNVAAGSAYLRTLLARFNGNTALAVAAYNAGPAAVERSGGIPPYPETQRYVGAVLAAYERWRAR